MLAHRLRILNLLKKESILVGATFGCGEKRRMRLLAHMQMVKKGERKEC